MGFDARDAIRETDMRQLYRELDRQRALHEASRGIALDYELQRQKMMPEIIRNERMLRSVASEQQVVENVRSAERMMASVMAPVSALSYHARVQSEVLRHDKMIRQLGLTNSLAQAFAAHDLAVNSVEWSLRRVQQSVRASSAMRPFLKTATAFGPIVIEPDYEDGTPFDYHPDLQWLFPETATEAGDAVDDEELWAEVVAFAQGIAVHYRTKVLLSVVGGRGFLIRVCNHPKVAQAIEGAISARIGYEIGGATGAVIGGAGGPLISYVLKRR